MLVSGFSTTEFFRSLGTSRVRSTIAGRSETQDAAPRPAIAGTASEPSTAVQDVLDLSVEAVAANQAALSDPDTESDTGTPKTAGTKAASGEDLSPEEIEQVEWLSARDREVRTHEQAHLAAAGPYARGGPTYTFQTGPDGRQYAIGGEVEIDTSPVKGDPEATAAKARVVRAAALAPAEPSGQDRKVAAQATQMEQQALAEVRERESEPEAASETGQFLDLFA